jgi:hypothetical protein
VSRDAYALYSNLNTTESGRAVYTWWEPFQSNATAADLTVGKLVPSGIEILYDSARLVIARSTVIIQDGLHSYENVAEVVSTLVYDKDTKYAEIYQDVKVLLSVKVLQSISAFCFSDRYELDVAAGVNPGDRSYVHYFANYTQSVYQDPLTGTNNTDVIQAFDPADQYIFFAGYWPNATEYTVYNTQIVPLLTSGSTGVLPTGTAIPDVPSPPGEPHIPWVTVQWLYSSVNWPNLTSWLAGGTGQMRFVEVPGMTNYNKLDPHPALDINAGNSSNQVDTEVLYLLNQVFNPTGLNSLANGGEGYPNSGSAVPFMWTGLGQSAATTDSGAAAMVGGNDIGTFATSLTLFDTNDTAFPYISPVVTEQGSIPYGLYSYNGTTYYQTFNNNADGTGTDTTNYVRTGLTDFALGYNLGTDPQPVAGGWGNSDSFWYPSIDPLSQRWSYSGTTFSTAAYTTVQANGILTLGGVKANGLTRYFNDFDYAITREGTTGTFYALVESGAVTGTAPTSNPADGTLDFFPVSTWNVGSVTFNYTDTANTGYAVISLASDLNGTRGLSIYGWNGRDTYWASAWASQYILGNTTGWLPAGVVSLVLSITYNGGSSEPTAFTVVKALGTITEFGTNSFITQYKMFDNREPALLNWTGAFTVPTTPRGYFGANVWWSAKLSPTSSIASVNYDP